MDMIREWFAAILAATGLGVWLVRLEGASKTALREIARLEKQFEADRSATFASRKEQNEMLREMRADIKRLLARSSPPRLNHPQNLTMPHRPAIAPGFCIGDPMTYYQNWKTLAASAWRWPDFSPAEIACRGTGKLIVNDNALDKLQALRRTLGRPMIVNSGYRSPEHNRTVGGAAQSMHLEGRAFDISMANHDPTAFITAARAAGFRGIGTYPRSNFVHIDTGPARSWGEPIPPRQSRFAVDTPPAPDRLADDTAIRAAGLAGAGTIAATGTELAQQALAETHDALAPLLPWLANARWLFVALALAGIALTITARLNDWKRGRR